MVTDGWAKIEALAGELLIWRKLDAAQIRAVIEKCHPRTLRARAPCLGTVRCKCAGWFCAHSVIWVRTCWPMRSCGCADYKLVGKVRRRAATRRRWLYPAGDHHPAKIKVAIKLASTDKCLAMSYKSRTGQID